MIKINLLPYRDIRKKEKLWMQIIVMAGSIVLGLLVVPVVHWQLISIEKNLAEGKERLNAEIADYDKKIGQIDKIKGQKNEIERKLQVIDMLNVKRIYAAMVMSKLAESVPEKMWLTQIDEREKEIVLTGEATQDSVVSDFMLKLEKTGIVTKINLISLDQSMHGDQKFVKFSLSTAKVDSGAKP